MPTLDKTTVDSLEPTTKSFYIWDDKIPGFGVRVTPAGTKTFVAKLFVDGRISWVKIGKHGTDITAAEARKKATALRGDAARGVDAGAAKKARKKEKTVSELLKIFKERRTDGLAKNTQTAYNHDAAIIGKALGKRLVNEVTKGDIEDLLVAQGNSHAAGNRIVQFCRTLFEAAIDWEIRVKANPAKKVKKHHDNRRERILTDEETERLGHAIACAQHLSANVRRAVMIMMVMGLRIGEVRDLKWSQIDLDSRTITFRWTEHKAGSKNGTKVLPINDPALEIFSTQIKMTGNPYVFWGVRSKDGSLGNWLSRAWRKIRDIAGLNDGLEDGDERIVAHSLRHTFVSEVLASGAGLPQAGLLAGHRSASSTSRYAHMVAGRGREISNLGVSRIASRLPITGSGTAVGDVAETVEICLDGIED